MLLSSLSPQVTTLLAFNRRSVTHGIGTLRQGLDIAPADSAFFSTGPIPAELGQLSNLMGLYLWGNNLSGSIPEELGKLSLLESLDLAQNQLLMSGEPQFVCFL